MTGAEPAEPAGSRGDLQSRAAFHHVPTPRPVRAAEISEAQSTSIKPSPDAANEKSFVFQQPAYFPQPGFGSNGCPIELDPAIIYEGMRIVHRREGTFSIHFTATRPNTAVRLRLQFQILDAAGNFKGTITLPIITLRPATDDLTDPGTRTYHVQHDGYSETIREMWCGKNPIHQCVDPTPFIRFARSGTARFGTMPESTIR
jgi:hypothetical protein